VLRHYDSRPSATVIICPVETTLLNARLPACTCPSCMQHGALEPTLKHNVQLRATRSRTPHRHFHRTHPRTVSILPTRQTQRRNFPASRTYRRGNSPIPVACRVIIPRVLSFSTQLRGAVYHNWTAPRGIVSRIAVVSSPTLLRVPSVPMLLCTMLLSCCSGTLRGASRTLPGVLEIKTRQASLASSLCPY
jgi:hypothetical protein